MVDCFFRVSLDLFFCGHDLDAWLKGAVAEIDFDSDSVVLVVVVVGGGGVYVVVVVVVVIPYTVSVVLDGVSVGVEREEYNPTRIRER